MYVICGGGGEIGLEAEGLDETEEAAAKVGFALSHGSVCVRIACTGYA